MQHSARLMCFSALLTVAHAAKFLSYLLDVLHGEKAPPQAPTHDPDGGLISLRQCTSYYTLTHRTDLSNYVRRDSDYPRL